MDAFTVSVDQIIELVRQLSPRERLRVVVEVLPGLEQSLPDVLPSQDFWQGIDMYTLAKDQGVHPVSDFGALLGGWPEDESVDDFVKAVRAERCRNLAEVVL